jgi:phosphoglycerol transferase MdoB-like AlkP superfamily enzyme
MDLFLPFVVVAGLLWFGLAMVVGWGAERRGANGALWFAIAVVTTPLIAALLLLAVTEARGPRGYR